MVNNRSILLKIYLTPEENQDLQARADAANLSRSHYGRAVLFSIANLSASGFPRPEQQLDDPQQGMSERQEAALLQLGQHYLLLSLLQSQMATCIETAGSSDLHLQPQPLLEQLQSIQTELTATQQVMEELADRLRQQQHPQPRA